MRKARACGDGVVRSTIRYEVSSPIGKIILVACAKGLHMLCQSPEIDDTNFSPDCRIDVELLGIHHNDTPEQKVVNEVVDWLHAYFNDLKNIGMYSLPKMCCLVENGSFHNKVLSTLIKKVPPGQVVSYSELANFAGSPRAQLSVGTAMAKNPFQLIVPCHRVIKRGNIVGKYSSGCRNSVKVWLLQHEGLIVGKDGTVRSE